MSSIDTVRARRIASRIGVPLEVYLRERAAGRKWCGRCRRFKPATAETFGVNRGNPDGLFGYCRPCASAKALSWAAANPDLVRARESARWKGRRDYVRAWRGAHRDHLRAEFAEWAALHADHRRRYHREHYRVSAATRARVKAAALLRKARLRGAAVGPVDLDAVYARDAGRCGICREPVARGVVHFDHIIPLSRGGAHHSDNLQPAHAVCNLKKRARLPEEMVP